MRSASKALIGGSAKCSAQDGESSDNATTRRSPQLATRSTIRCQDPMRPYSATSGHCSPANPCRTPGQKGCRQTRRQAQKALRCPKPPATHRTSNLPSGVSSRGRCTLATLTALSTAGIRPAGGANFLNSHHFQRR